ncbi:hypothetical protein T492DRAFT_938483 [Pavlovales sp. CCMP2436]|nr:hypothetical protein T492DRAFT_938483 [Pavlovales sp. CCMP2436]
MVQGSQPGFGQAGVGQSANAGGQEPEQEQTLEPDPLAAPPHPFKIAMNVDNSVFRLPLTLEAALEPSSDMIVICVQPLQPPTSPGQPASSRPWYYVVVCKPAQLDDAEAARALALVAVQAEPRQPHGAQSSSQTGSQSHKVRERPTSHSVRMGGCEADTDMQGEALLPLRVRKSSVETMESEEMEIEGALKPRVAPFISKLFQLVRFLNTSFCNSNSFNMNLFKGASSNCRDHCLEYAHQLFSVQNRDRLHEIKRGATSHPSSQHGSGGGLSGRVASASQTGKEAGRGAKRPLTHELPEAAEVQAMIQQHKARIINVDQQFHVAHTSIRMLIAQICEKLVMRCHQANGGPALAGKYDALVHALRQMHADSSSKAGSASRRPCP